MREAGSERTCRSRARKFRSAEAKKLFEAAIQTGIDQRACGRRRKNTIYETLDRYRPATFSSTSAAAATWKTRRRFPPMLSSSTRSRAPTGAATRRIRCSSASTAWRSGVKKNWKNILKCAKRPKSATTKNSVQQLDLFTFSDLVGPGLPLWTPKGTLVRNLLDDFVWELRKARGYVQVDIPHITKKELYETSGHWEKFKDELFKITTREGHRLRHEADELPAPHADLCAPAMELPRASPALCDTRPRCTATSSRANWPASRACSRSPRTMRTSSAASRRRKRNS